VKWLVVLAIALVPRIAYPCECASRPSLAISPPSQSVLPPNPRLYVFVPVIDDVVPVQFTVTNIHAAAPVETLHERIVDRNPEYVVYELELGAREGAIQLDFSSGGTLVTAFYTIADATPDDAARVIGISLGSSGEDCSDDAGRIWLDVAGSPAALRFDWDDHTSTVIAPDVLAWNEPAWNVDQPLRMRIGAFCGHTNVTRPRLAASHHFGLYALFADGTSRRLGGSELELSDFSAHLPFDLLDQRVALPPTRTLERIIECVDRRLSIEIGAATGGLVGILYLVLARIAARRRRHRPRYSAGLAEG
jgi:hypothetical protein